MPTSAAVSIMVRARITPDEWVRLRKLALDRNTSTSEMIGGLLRDFVDLHDPQREGEKK